MDGMTLVCIPAGDFQMGSTDEQIRQMRAENPNWRISSFMFEKPAHTVYLDAYWMDQTEVTNAQYARCVAAGACQAPESAQSRTRYSYYGNLQYADYPVVYVSWEDAVDYCTWAGRQMPSEAQWEKAARGTDGRIYPWGNQSPNANLLNYNDILKDTIAVGSYPGGASPYGVLDLAGNVWEMTADWSTTDYTSTQTSWSNPTGPATGDYRELRGGSWNYNNWGVRAALRTAYDPNKRVDHIGFRCILSTAP